MTAAELAAYGYAVLDNLGPNGWDLRVRVGQIVHHLTFSNQKLADDQSPRDYAVAELSKLGWKVQGDGSWYVNAWTGPGSGTTWAGIVPLDNTTPDDNRS